MTSEGSGGALNRLSPISPPLARYPGVNVGAKSLSVELACEAQTCDLAKNGRGLVPAAPEWYWPYYRKRAPNGRALHGEIKSETRYLIDFALRISGLGFAISGLDFGLSEGLGFWISGVGFERFGRTRHIKAV
eukprot:3941987-Rhodomonas_salina.5